MSKSNDLTSIITNLNQKSRNLFLITVLGTCFLWTPSLINKFKINLFNSIVAKTWSHFRYEGDRSDDLQDNIPDGWRVALWDQALAAYRLDADQTYQGIFAANIQKNTEIGRAMLSQEFSVVGKKVECGVYHKGAAGFLRIISDHLISREILTLPASEKWSFSSLNFTMSTESSVANIYLGIGAGKGEIWFDDVYCHSSDLPDNVLNNGSFEIDGNFENSSDWWIHLLDYQEKSDTYENVVRWVAENTSIYPIPNNFLNTADLLNGDLQSVVDRMSGISGGCYLDEGSPIILLSLSPRFQMKGGLSISERLAQLGIKLMPNCPQSYAFLGSLYESVNSYDLAARYYQEAAMRSIPGAQKGLYLFEQGRISIAGTGNYSMAISALTQAVMHEGWERSPWYRGAALIELGNAYTQAGLYENARGAYQAVLDCRACYARHSSANYGLHTLEDNYHD